MVCQIPHCRVHRTLHFIVKTSSSHRSMAGPLLPREFFVCVGLKADTRISSHQPRISWNIRTMCLLIVTVTCRNTNTLDRLSLSTGRISAISTADVHCSPKSSFRTLSQQLPTSSTVVLQSAIIMTARNDEQNSVHSPTMSILCKAMSAFDF